MPRPSQDVVSGTDRDYCCAWLQLRSSRRRPRPKLKGKIPHTV